MLDRTLREQVSLKPMNTFGVEARARWYAEVASPTDLSALLADERVVDRPVLVLGGGSNLLLTRDPAGLVVRYTDEHIRVIAPGRDSHLVEVGAGRSWHAFVEWSLANGYVGLENLALIPGTVGAAPIQNIGAYGVEVESFVNAVEVFDRERRCTTIFKHDFCEFAYRFSRFKRDDERDRYIVVNVRFRLPRSGGLRLDYPGIREELATMQIAAPGAQDVFDAVVRLRRRKLPDPAQIGNAGSFFKNPVVSTDVAQALLSAHPSAPNFDAGAGQRKLSAGWLIDQCGLKGYRDGDAGVSAQHALVLVNHGNASGIDIWRVAQHVQACVRNRFAITLDPEPVVI
ncbi:MAG: UDP-N-acetylmuramate dehydrogenase [Xanthomonadales bacterium]|jgi:UDP-N-acetylmuramate dehydrogenase|nr:UDP-N-acetylmuramate dehydrogenase [Xanthomonadales bacterium]MBP7625264.1 UDP-N-acetylmuramate dehydrogenase [Xanthomonadales bacterium]